MDFLSLFKLFIVKHLFKKEKYIFSGGIYLVVPFLFLLKMAGSNVIFDMYDFPFHKKNILWREKVVFYVFSRYLIAFTDKIIFETEGYFDTFIRNSGVAFLDNEKYIIMPVFAKPKKIKRIPADNNFIYIGNFAKTHDIDWALEHLHFSSMDFQFYLIGEDRKGRMKRLKEKYINDSRFNFLGFVENIDVYLENATLGFGIFGTDQKSIDSITNKVWEYVEWNIPVITSRNSLASKYFVEFEEMFFCESECDFVGIIQDILSCKYNMSAISESANNKMLIHKSKYLQCSFY